MSKASLDSRKGVKSCLNGQGAISPITAIHNMTDLARLMEHQSPPPLTRQALSDPFHAVQWSGSRHVCGIVDGLSSSKRLGIEQFQDGDAV